MVHPGHTTEAKRGVTLPLPLPLLFWVAQMTCPLLFENASTNTSVPTTDIDSAIFTLSTTVATVSCTTRLCIVWIRPINK